MIKKILIILVTILITFVSYVYSRPSEFHVVRSITISSSPREAFDYVNSQVKWEEWSPWANLDPKAEKFFSEPVRGVGSIYKWSGNNKIGAGTSVIVESRENELVKLRLDFEKPRKGVFISEFYFLKQGTEVLVTWNIYGNKDFVTKLFGLFVNSEESAGVDLEKGLKNLKTVVERSNKIRR